MGGVSEDAGDGLGLLRSGGRLAAGEKELADGLRALIARLPLFEREVYWLAAREDCDDRAIAIRLGIGIDEVQHHLAAALVRIAKALDDGEGD